MENYVSVKSLEFSNRCRLHFEYDPRVREGRRVLDGVRLPKEDDFWKKYFPPNGWNCRCTTLDIWYDDAEAKINFGVTGRDPRKRAPEEMDVSKEFQGNVGIFATQTPTKTAKTSDFRPVPPSPNNQPTQPKTTPKTAKTTVKKEAEKIQKKSEKTSTSPLTSDESKFIINNNEIQAVLSRVRAFYGTAIADRLEIRPTSTGCDVFIDGEKVAKVEVEKDGIQFAIGRGRYRLLKGKVIKSTKAVPSFYSAISRIIQESGILEGIVYKSNEKGDDLIAVASQDMIDGEKTELNDYITATPQIVDDKISHTKTCAENFILDKLEGKGKSSEGMHLERGVCISPDGKITEYHIGQEDRIQLDPKKDWKGFFVTHSHPSNSIFSGNDFIAFFELELEELSAVTTHGTYRMVRCENSVSREEGIQMAERLVKFLLGEKGKNIETLRKKMKWDEYKRYASIIRNRNNILCPSRIEVINEFLFEKYCLHFKRALTITYEVRNE